MTTFHKSDFLILGSGIAGLFIALQLAEVGLVHLITKKKETDTNTNLAQGGIAAVLDQSDTFAAHVEDTMRAGAGLGHREVVDLVVRKGPECLQELIALGVSFSRNPASETGYDLAREGGHSCRRILHAADWTGREIEAVLVASCREHKNIVIWEDMAAIDLLTAHKWLGSTLQDDYCWGTYALERASGRVHAFVAGATVLASGGAGKVYLYTTNPDIATGDGVAMAHRAGARVANMEFFQFHPTCLYHPAVKNFLISEAVRGEGAILKLKDGSSFMAAYDERRELAPRDIVARAIDYEMKTGGDDCVFLDISFKPADFIRHRFPLIYSTCLKLGIDITLEPIPVVPAAHYLCGGVQVDKRGRTSLPGLYASGEVACTGLHGANRLASNSLLEAVVYSSLAAADIKKEHARKSLHLPEFPEWRYTHSNDPDENVVITQNWDEIRRFMWNYVGIVRSHKRLLRAKRRIDSLAHELHEFYWDQALSVDLLELRNIAVVADLIITSALYRKESRGLHYNIDYPERDDDRWLVDTVLEGGQCYSRKTTLR
ncbi:MAG: L-aspartate oxidase [Deltaproteobacteria bacterium]|nr:L-aspartate oxidase [Deltaproteobacteria bacterium]